MLVSTELFLHSSFFLFFISKTYIFNDLGTIRWIDKSEQSQKCRCMLDTFNLNLHDKLVQSSQRVVFKGIQEITIVYQVIVINPGQFVVEMLKKIKFDSLPFLRFIKIIIPQQCRLSSMQVKAQQNITNLVKNFKMCLY